MRTPSYPQDPRWGPDHQIEFFIDFAGTPNDHEDDQRFLAYLFSGTRNAMAGVTWWNGTPFGMHATKIHLLGTIYVAVGPLQLADFGGGLRLLFTEVTRGGALTSAVGTLPEPLTQGLRPVGEPRSITVEAHFSGDVQVTLPFDPADVSGDPATLRLLHHTAAGWEDCTESVDPETGTVTGRTTSLGVFVVAEPGSLSQATTLSLQGPGSPPAYNTATNLRATLRTATGLAGAGHRIAFERYDGRQWRAVGSALTDAASVARLSSGALTTAVRFRARFAGDDGYEASDSAVLTVAPKAWLSTPSAPTTASRGKAFTAAGYLKPRHLAGTYPVRLQCYRSEKRANGSYAWVLRKTVSAKAGNYLSYTRYSAKVTLSLAGRWRMRARHLDASHALTYSGWRYVTVK